MFGLNKDKKNLQNHDSEDKTLDQKIEAILFFKGQEVSLSFLAKTLNVDKKEIIRSVDVLSQRLNASSLCVVSNGENFLLSIKGDFSSLIEKFREKEEYGELSKSALETISIVLYKGPITRFEIDQIRGVNSSYILRNLSIRGLVESKKEDGKTLYMPTTDLLGFLSITKKEDLPDFDTFLTKIDNILKTSEQENTVSGSEKKQEAENEDTENSEEEIQEEKINNS